jgi:hypothetical protein
MRYSLGPVQCLMSGCLPRIWTYLRTVILTMFLQAHGGFCVCNGVLLDLLLCPGVACVKRSLLETRLFCVIFEHASISVYADEFARISSFIKFN